MWNKPSEGHREGEQVLMEGKQRKGRGHRWLGAGTCWLYQWCPAKVRKKEVEGEGLWHWFIGQMGWMEVCVWRVGVVVVGCLTFQQHASVSQGWICTILRAATLSWKLQTKLSTSPSHSILTPGRPVPALTQVPGRLATGVPVFKSLVWLDPEKFWRD